MKEFILVKKLGGERIGPHFLPLIPRAGEHVIGSDSKVWKIEAVGHYSHSTAEHRGPFGELQVTPVTA
jgi:hypothetical protein